ncbi:MAG: CBS domain-containing protein [Actinomycetota bacterium]|nr:CBS domain-containing protein [Actinomycetota bacterium]
MGLLSNIVSFGAGYALGTKTGAAPIQRLKSTMTRGGSSRTSGVLPRDAQVRDVMTAASETVTLDTPLTAEEIFSRDLVAASSADSVGHVIELMEDLQVRRVPVVEADRAVGIVSLGDLASRRTVGSAPRRGQRSRPGPLSRTPCWSSCSC